MNINKVTDKQVEFLSTIHAEGYETEYWECFDNERSTAIQLRKRGIVEFEDGEYPSKEEEWFMCRMTKEGFDWFVTKEMEK